MRSCDLARGRTYFRVTYADRGLTMPTVEPLVYIGDVELAEGGLHHAFQDTVSYSMYGSRLQPGAVDRDDLEVYFIPPEEIGVDVVDLSALAQKITASLDRARALDWPLLTCPPAGAV